MLRLVRGHYTGKVVRVGVEKVRDEADLADSGDSGNHNPKNTQKL